MKKIILICMLMANLFAEMPPLPSKFKYTDFNYLSANTNRLLYMIDYDNGTCVSPTTLIGNMNNEFYTSEINAIEALSKNYQNDKISYVLGDDFITLMIINENEKVFEFFTKKEDCEIYFMVDKIAKQLEKEKKAKKEETSDKKEETTENNNVISKTN